ncbi:lactonase family protein [Actomonas aquatica]|uniref:Lactonase family protein n=1 Tax=Actomonas aquatica TaxID=2866162 RepID=A0ABZ1C9A5_9BACT|nr:lactonase family protein [Opitutus sp. WL0086]WRQ87992.1 lactonase family protein [Opitutus sp. WL0086]
MRQWLATLSVIAVGMAAVGAPEARTESRPLWVQGGAGIHRLELDDETGALAGPEALEAFAGSSWLVAHPTRNVVFSSRGGEVAGIGYYTFDAGGTLTELGRRALPGGAPTHIAISADGRILATAHYGSGTVSVMRLGDPAVIGADGITTLALPFIGSGSSRAQQQARAHWLGFRADGRRLDVVDLGNDCVWTLAVDEEATALTITTRLEFPAGTGPRHMAFAPDGEWAYVNGELDSTVHLLRPAADGIGYERVAGWSTLPADHDEPSNSTSEVRVHPSGRFLYVGNRGHDSIAVFSIDADDGTLTAVEQEPVRGSWPRNFVIDPSGRWLVVAGRHSNTVAVFAIDAETGRLSFVRRSIVNVPDPVRVLFVPKARE